MPLIHNALYRGALTKFAKSAFGVPKSPGGVERYSETLDVIANPWERPEWAHLLEHILWAKFVQQVAVVGELSGVAIANPADSDMLVVVERCTALNAVAGGTLQMAPVSQATVAATYTFADAITRDTRSRTSLTVSVPQVWFGSDPVSLLSGGFRLEQITDPTVEFKEFRVGVPYVIGPGRALLVEAAVANQGLNVCYAGYVRHAFPGELV